MTFNKKKLAWLGFILLALMLLCVPLCGNTPTEDVLATTNEEMCESVVKDYSVYLFNKTTDMVRKTTSRDKFNLLIIIPHVKELRCRANSVDVEVLFFTKFQLNKRLRNGKVDRDILCVRQRMYHRLDYSEEEITIKEIPGRQSSTVGVTCPSCSK